MSRGTSGGYCHFGRGANDGVKPQTEEVIQIIRRQIAVVAVNKMIKPVLT